MGAEYMGTALQPVPQSTPPPQSPPPLPPRWPSSRSARTIMRSARLWSTSRSTWSFMEAMSTWPLPITSTGLTMHCQTKRGGKVVLQDIAKPTRMEWGTPMEAMIAVLELEKTVTKALQDLQTVATEKKDFHLVDFIQQQFIVKKVNVIKEIGDFLTKIRRACDGTGIYIVDKELEKAVVTQTVVDVQSIVSHCVSHSGQGRVLGKQVQVLKEIADCLATVRIA